MNRASDTTWLWTLCLLAGSVTAPCPHCGHGDPMGTVGPPLDYGHPGPCRR